MEDDKKETEDETTKSVSREEFNSLQKGVKALSNLVSKGFDSLVKAMDTTPKDTTNPDKAKADEAEQQIAHEAFIIDARIVPSNVLNRIHGLLHAVGNEHAVRHIAAARRFELVRDAALFLDGIYEVLLDDGFAGHDKYSLSVFWKQCVPSFSRRSIQYQTECNW